MNLADQLGTIDGDTLTARLNDLVATERRATADVLVYLAEMFRRELHVDHASSLFTYCRDVLGYRKSAAFRRDVVARLIVRLPAVGAAITDGSLSLTAAFHLAAALTADNAADILARAAHASERTVRDLVASLPPPDGVPAPEPRPVTVAITQACADDLDQLADLTSHSHRHPDRAALIHTCVLSALRTHLRRRRGAEHARNPNPNPNPNPNRVPRTRHIPAHIRHTVWLRDAGCCTHISPTGRRCRETRFLQFHHLHAYAHGGPHTAANLTLRCGPHNRLAARPSANSARTSIHRRA